MKRNWKTLNIKTKIKKITKNFRDMKHNKKEYNKIKSLLDSPMKSDDWEIMINEWDHDRDGMFNNVWLELYNLRTNETIFCKDHILSLSEDHLFNVSAFNEFHNKYTSFLNAANYVWSTEGMEDLDSLKIGINLSFFNEEVYLSDYDKRDSNHPVKPGVFKGVMPFNLLSKIKK